MALESLRRVVEDTDTKVGRTFDIFIQLLIVASLVAFSVETLPDLSSKTKDYLATFELISVAIFSVEYLLRVLVAKNRLKFIFSFYGLIDLIAILPFYIARGVDLRSIRVVRLARLFRILRALRVLKLARYSKALRRYGIAFRMIREELILFLVATCFVLYLAAVGIYHFEHDVQPENFSSVFHCMWWGVTTLTTVGYGDVYPVTVGGRAFTTLILMLGLGIIAVPTGLLSSALTQTLRAEESKD